MTQPDRERRFHLPSFLLGVVAALVVGGVILIVLGGACRPEPVPTGDPVPVDGQTTSKPIGQP